MTMLKLASGIIAILGFLSAAHAADISGNAFINDDGSLRVDGRTIYLYGIHIPATDQNCRTNERPVRCGSRAKLALEFKIADFVHCDPTERRPDGTFTGLCRSGGIDLSAYLLERGWAMALPDAPFDYVALERIASRRGVGVWGFPVEPGRPRPHR